MAAKLLTVRVRTAAAGTIGLVLSLPAGCRLKRVTGGNGTHYYNHINIYLVPTSFAPGGATTTALPDDRCSLKFGQQGGVREGVGWNGDIVIDKEYSNILVQHMQAQVGDDLDIHAIVEVS